MSNSIYILGATRNLEKKIVLVIVKLQFSEFLYFGYLAIQIMESQPKLAISYSQKNLNKHNAMIWGPV